MKVGEIIPITMDNKFHFALVMGATVFTIALFAFGALPPVGGVTDTVTIDNVTVHNCGYNDGNTPPWSYGIAAPIYTTTSDKTNRNANITNTIISGSGMTGLYNDSDGTFSIDYSARTAACYA